MLRLLFLSFVLSATSMASASDWAEFLGPNGSAKSTDSVVTSWSSDQNLLWKVDLPGSGSSSPIIVGDRVMLTCYTNDDSSSKRQIMCFDKRSGKSLWASDYPVDYREDSFQGYITEHGYASNTPVSDGEFVYVFFGKGGVHCLDLDGRKIWSVDVGKESSNRQWGSAASLVLFEDSVIVNAAEESKSIIALDKATGKELWRQEAGMLELTYGTPRLATLADGSRELVISVPSEIWALDPLTGKLNWYASTSMSGNVCPSTIVDGENIYAFGGYRSSGSIAIRAGGKDDVGNSNTLWTSRLSSYVATPLLYQGRLYWIDDKGIAYCSSAETGEQIYRERVSELEGGRPVYASPILIANKIFVVSRRRGTFVYAPGDKFELVSQNILEGDDTDFNASPAVSDGRLYLRSNQSLYCIGG
ncbi:PQQ-binding-like beta-propeller repeat protein [Aureliella helgolandensis]|uniref:Outer membrane biogenesis protein BamB n=1 Tax=Aureliella helgolandensis TaxID=2527968 RepID=A0A518G7V6_9BACT|nr:PQQ-binding-like beta-propeller repeat protein [Aureliella helgolandensis]QDV24678.1 outer membrane biogenesis protein BamB [Aureliella helgolandensis]